DFHVTGVQTCALPIWDPDHGRLLASVKIVGGSAGIGPPVMAAKIIKMGGTMRMAFEISIGDQILGSQFYTPPEDNPQNPESSRQIGRAPCRERVKIKQ